MKGIVFNLLEQFLEENFAEAKYEEILSRCSLRTDEPFIGPESYPDEDLFTLVSKTVELTGVSSSEILRRFGKFGFKKLAEKFPHFVSNFDHPKPFLKTVESVVHIEVKKLFQDAEPPAFIYDDPAPDRLIIRYSSGRKLCQFMGGMIEGVSDYFKSPIQYKENHCMLDGADTCEFDLTFPETER